MRHQTRSLRPSFHANLANLTRIPPDPNPFFAPFALPFSRVINQVNGGDVSFFSLVSTGAQYFISDVEGYNLKAKGLMCNGDTKYQCFIRLTEGTYVLRLGGGSTTYHHALTSCLQHPYTHVHVSMLVPCRSGKCSHFLSPVSPPHPTNDNNRSLWSGNDGSLR